MIGISLIKIFASCLLQVRYIGIFFVTHGTGKGGSLLGGNLLQFVIGFGMVRYHLFSKAFHCLVHSLLFRQFAQLNFGLSAFGGIFDEFIITFRKLPSLLSR